MVPRDDDGSPAGAPSGNPPSRCDDRTGASPVSVSVGAPSSRPAAEGETPTAEAGFRKRASQQKLISEKQARGPQQEVKPAASTEEQSESRAGHFAAKATSTTRVPKRGVDLGGVEGAARVQGSSRNTRGPSAQPLSWLDESTRPSAKAFIAQRKSDGVTVPTKTALHNAIGGKGHEREHVADEGKREGMTERSNSPAGKRKYFLHRQPSQRAMQRIRQKVRDRTLRGRCHADLREVIADLNPILRGWGAYFATGNAARSFNQIDGYVYERLRGLRLKRTGRHLVPGAVEKWDRDYFWGLGLHRLRGTVMYPETTQYHWSESSPASRVREIRTHGFHGGRTETHNEGK